MGQVHDLLEAKGKQTCLDLYISRGVVEAAAAYMSYEDASKAFIFSGWTQAALPHRRLPDEQTWQITSERVTLLVEPGKKPNPVQGLPPIAIGVPYGSRARLIMLYLQTEALRTGCREVELGRSLRVWLGRMGIAIGGKSVRDVRDQAERISRCRLTFHANLGSGSRGLVNQNIVDEAIFLDGEHEADGGLFTESATLSESFFRQLQKHPVPLEDAAIRAIANNSMALDVYCWLAYRLHVLPAPTLVTWKAAMGQFGAGFAQMKSFKQRFQPNLELALAVYRDARVETNERGLTLHPSRPPVAKLGVASLRG